MYIVEPFHKGIIDRQNLIIICRRVGRAFVLKLVAVEAHASNLEQDATIDLIIDRVESIEHFSSGTAVIFLAGLDLVSFLSGSSLADHVLVTVFHGPALSSQEIHFMEQSRDTVHLDYVLYVLFLA